MSYDWVLKDRDDSSDGVDGRGRASDPETGGRSPQRRSAKAWILALILVAITGLALFRVERSVRSENLLREVEGDVRAVVELEESAVAAADVELYASLQEHDGSRFGCRRFASRTTKPRNFGRVKESDANQGHGLTRGRCSTARTGSRRLTEAFSNPGMTAMRLPRGRRP